MKCNDRIARRLKFIRVNNAAKGMVIMIADDYATIADELRKIQQKEQQAKLSVARSNEPDEEAEQLFYELVCNSDYNI